MAFDPPRPPSDDDVTLPLRPAGAGAGPSGELPAEIGGYVIRGRLGEGGMGIVFAAEQRSPPRPVALKVIRGGSFADELSVRLFQREAETLARLRHPNIAAIYESGTTTEGRHFFAMELVRGDTLDVWMRKDGRGAASRTRLELFRVLADAVHHAHQRGVIHRDLKPANVKVTPAEEGSRDGRASIKVLDFGLARLVDRDAENTVLSTPGAVRGTLRYMSPEQARGAVDEIDVRTDVYSLGVILYELLTDRVPYDTNTGSVLDAARVICDQDPAPMSRMGPARIDGDLETIARKALAKRPDERYASAAALSDDVGRWLAGEPIQARPPSTMYQLRKLLGRHRLPVMAAVAGLALVVAFGIGMSVLYARSERNLERAVVAEAQARGEANRANETAGFLVDIFEVADPYEARGSEVTAREILDRGAQRIRQELVDSPEVQAQLMDTIGVVYRQLGLMEASEELHRQSLDVRRRHFGEASTPVAVSLTNLSMTLRELSRFDEAEETSREALRIWELHPEKQGRSAYGVSLGHHANILENLGRYDESLALQERALRVMSTVAGERSKEVLDVQNNLGTLLMTVDPPRASVPLEKALELSEELLSPDDPRRADALTNLAVLSSRLGDAPRSRQLHEQALEIQLQAFGPDHPVVARSLENLAIARSESGELEAALPLFEESLATFERVFGPEHVNVGQSLHNLGYTYLQAGDLDRAEERLKRAMEIRGRHFGPDHPAVGLSMYWLASIERERGRLGEARKLLERVVEIDEGAFGKDHPDVAEDLTALAAVLEAMGDPEAAARATARADAIRSRYAEGMEGEEGPADPDAAPEAVSGSG